ncbi:(S)-ureidoglycine aminohydrolase [Salix suchowensis]|nr:(S)-ureidoglycine aminohydrolase [Salix suchowensis]
MINHLLTFLIQPLHYWFINEILEHICCSCPTSHILRVSYLDILLQHMILTPRSIFYFAKILDCLPQIGILLKGLHFIIHLSSAKIELPPYCLDLVAAKAVASELHHMVPSVAPSSKSLLELDQNYCPNLYDSLENHVTEQIVGSTDQQPLLETPGEVFELRKLPPQSLLYDFNIHIMDFQPGEFLNVKEVHYNQHGLLLLEGQGIYRLGDSWYPVQSGDAIWMAPFAPQWYATLGKTRTRYLLYKDVNRNPL